MNNNIHPLCSKFVITEEDWSKPFISKDSKYSYMVTIYEDSWEDKNNITYRIVCDGRGDISLQKNNMSLQETFNTYFAIKDYTKKEDLENQGFFVISYE